MFPKHVFTARITRSNSSKVNKQQRVIQVTAAERTREIGEAAHIARFLVSGNLPNVALAGLYAIPATSHQMTGLVDRQAYLQII